MTVYWFSCNSIFEREKKRNWKLSMCREDLVQACVGPVIVISVVWTELSCFRGPFSPSVLCLLCLPHSICLSFFGILRALMGGILGNISLRAVYSKVALVSNQTSVGYFHKMCATIALAYLASRTDGRSSILWLDCFLSYCFHSLKSTFLYQRY